MAIDDSPNRDALGGAVDFIENSYLSYIIPSTTDLNLEDASEKAEDTRSLFDTIKQRETLFFDETTDVYLILRTPLVDEDALRSCLARLHISLEAQIINADTTDRDGQQQADTIFQGFVEDTDDPFIVVDAADDSDDDDNHSPPHIYAVWKLPVFLARPRMRLQNPIVSFRASASLKPVDAATALGEKAGYKRSGVPAGFNILEAFGNDQALGGVAPKLSALRVSRVAPVTQARHMMKPIRAQASLDLKILPAIHTRVRFSRTNSAPATASVVALLEVDFTSHFNCRAVLNEIRLSAAGSTVDDLNKDSGMTLPMTCVANDHITFLYRLAPQRIETGSKLPTRNLDISIEATLQAIPDVCTPKLKLSWTTTVDFTIPVNPGYGLATQPIQRAHRPSQLSIGGSEAGQSLTAPAVSRPDALPALEAATSRSSETTIPDLGLTLTFCAPEQPVYVGEPFSWTIYVVNRSTEKSTTTTTSRRLALVAILKRRRNDTRVIRPPSTAGNGKTVADGRLIADAVLDENVVHAMQRSSLVDSTDVVCLSADTRIGPLAPGACHVVELKFVAFRLGIVELEAIRVVDLGSQEHIDVRELPVMVVGQR